MTGLDRRWVVVTRAARQSRALVDAIIDAGGAVVPLPLLEIRPAPDGERTVAASVEMLGPDDWLAILSPNGSRSVLAAVSTPPRCRVAAVARATAAPLEAAGWSIDLMPVEPTAKGLAAALCATAEPGNLLIVQAADGRPTLADELRASGWSVDVVTGYVNAVPELAPESITAARDADIVAFASPSAVERYVRHVGLEPELAACIGPVTEAAARAAGFDTVTASEPTVGALVRAMIERLG